MSGIDPKAIEFAQRYRKLVEETGYTLGSWERVHLTKAGTQLYREFSNNDALRDIEDLLIHEWGMYDRTLTDEEIEALRVEACRLLGPPWSEGP